MACHTQNSTDVFNEALSPRAGIFQYSGSLIGKRYTDPFEESFLGDHDPFKNSDSYELMSPQPQQTLIGNDSTQISLLSP